MLRYNPSQVMIVLGGIVVDGIAEGTFIEVEFQSDSFMLGKGGDGKHNTRIEIADRSALIRVHVTQSSPTNDRFSVLHEADRLRGVGVLPFLLADPSGTTKLTAKQSYIKRRPAIGYSSNGLETRVWTIETDDLGGLIGSGGEMPAPEA